MFTRTMQAKLRGWLVVFVSLPLLLPDVKELTATDVIAREKPEQLDRSLV